jgi:hypothetical protein
MVKVLTAATAHGRVAALFHGSGVQVYSLESHTLLIDDRTGILTTASVDSDSRLISTPDGRIIFAGKKAYQIFGDLPEVAK